MKFRLKSATFDAEQFDPQKQPLSAGVIQWRNDEAQPRDMSFGYINSPGGRIHVKAGDWVSVGPSGEIAAISDKLLHAIYEPVETPVLKWNKSSDNPPPSNTQLLGCWWDGSIAVFTSDSLEGEAVWRISDGIICISPSYWMPLPESPKEEVAG